MAAATPKKKESGGEGKTAPSPRPQKSIWSPCERGSQDENGLSGFCGPLQCERREGGRGASPVRILCNNFRRGTQVTKKHARSTVYKLETSEAVGVEGGGNEIIDV